MTRCYIYATKHVQKILFSYMLLFWIFNFVWKDIDSALGDFNLEISQKAELFKAIVTIIPVISGALIGLLGAVVGNVYLHKLNSKSSRLLEKRSKLELLVTECFEIDIWVKKQNAYYFQGKEYVLEQPPLSKIKALTAMYFEELEYNVLTLSSAFIEYECFLKEAKLLKTKSDTNKIPLEHLERIDEYSNPLSLETDKLINAAKTLMSKLTAP